MRSFVAPGLGDSESTNGETRKGSSAHAGARPCGPFEHSNCICAAQCSTRRPGAQASLIYLLRCRFDAAYDEAHYWNVGAQSQPK